jgi:putative membrane-bound dehydrogenase-like protein
MRASIVGSGPASRLVIGACLLATATLTARQQPAAPQPAPPRSPASETRDRYLNPRETDLSLGLTVDPADVPDIPPVEPGLALETFRVKKGFRLEMVAHEPLVVDPIQMAFDEDGRLYVVEMRWYQSETRSDLMFDERIGRIRLLEDTDGDGRFEKSTIFADKLRYPSAVFPYDGGVYVGLEPDIVYMKDRNGDGVADDRRVVFTGFGNHRDRLDSQMFLNSLAWGLDNRIHGAKGHGGTIVQVAAPETSPLDLRSRDFSFDPRTHRMRAESGGGKQGLSFDDYGRKFVSTQSGPFQVLMYEDRYAGRNPFFAPPRALLDISLEAGETSDRQRVNRISPEDPWRRVRNRWRAEGIFAGPPPKPAGYITAATGVMVYRGNAFPDDYRDSVFVGASANNLVHRRTLTPDGVGYHARRNADESEEEFLASTDIWFRPVAFANGPDGALYIADLYREIIDFSDGVPESIKRFKDLNRGNDRGRIYRVVPEGFQRPPVPRLGSATTAELVTTLEHPNAWHRESASRLLYTRQDKSAVPALVRLTGESPSALGRLHALYALDGLDALAEPYVLRALDDPEAGVREHGVRLAERIIGTQGLSPRLWERLKARIDDSVPRVRYQLAFTLGELEHPDRISALAALLDKDIRDRWMQTAILTSLAEGPAELFRMAIDQPGAADSPDRLAFLSELVRVLGARNKGRELLTAVEFLEGISKRDSGFTLLAAFADGLQRADVPLALVQPRLQPILDRARLTVRDLKSPEATRVQAIELLGLAAPVPETTAALFALIQPSQPWPVQRAAITALARLDAPQLAEGLLHRWPQFTPAIKREVLPLLLARPDRVLALLEAVRTSVVRQNELTPTQVAGMRAHRSADVRRVAGDIFKLAAPGDRQAVIQRYRPSLDLPGSVVRGRLTFQSRCAACHQAGGTGFALGPSVGSMKSFTREEALAHILDPNRTIDARYRLHLAETTDGRTVTGIIETETDSSVTLRQPSGAGTMLLRSRIARLQSLEQSMMPEGLEDGLSVQDMADLLQFVLGSEGSK